MNFFISDGYQKSTAHISESKRQFEFWHDTICDEFVRLDCEAQEQNRFAAELRGGVGVGTLRFAEVISDPHQAQRTRQQISKTSEADFLISFQLANQGLVRQNGREAILTPGSFALYDSTQPYTLSFKDNFHQFIVQMPKDVLGQHLMNPEQYTAIAMQGSSGLGAILTNFILSLAQEAKHLSQSSNELSGNLVNMIAMALSSSVMLEQVGEHSVVQDSVIKRVHRYIEMNLSNSNLSNQSIADAQGISTRYLNKLFKEEAQSVHGLVLEKRLQRGLAYLQDPAYQGHSIESIAYNIGFTSAAHFSRCFKKRFGQNPSSVR